MQDFILLEPALGAPDAAFEDAAGQSVKLDDFRGKVVVLNFWATWCPPCVKEMPALDKLQAELGGEDFEVVAISVDREGFDAVGPFYAHYGLENLAVYLDQTASLQQQFGISGLPVTFILDRDGMVRGGYAGDADWAGPEARALIEHYLALPAAGSKSDT